VGDDDRARPDRDEARTQGRRLAGRSTRFWVVTGLSLLGFVLLVQNSTNTPVRVLFWTVQMPLLFLLAAMVLLGILVDRLWLWRQRRR
jgi:uncharacterized integral membrane protein